MHSTGSALPRWTLRPVSRCCERARVLSHEHGGKLLSLGETAAPRVTIVRQIEDHTPTH